MIDLKETDRTRPKAEAYLGLGGLMPSSTRSSQFTFLTYERNRPNTNKPVWAKPPIIKTVTDLNCAAIHPILALTKAYQDNLY